MRKNKKKVLLIPLIIIAIANYPYMKREYNKRKHIENMSKITVQDNSTVTLSNLEEPIGYIKIPSIDVIENTYNGLEEEHLAQGIGVAKYGKNTLYVEHRDTEERELFRNLDKLQVGDTIQTKDEEGEKTWTITESETVLPEELNNLQQKKREITLITCTPYMINSHRIVVKASENIVDKPKLTKEEERTVKDTVENFLRKVITISIILTTLDVIMEREEERKKENE